MRFLILKRPRVRADVLLLGIAGTEDALLRAHATLAVQGITALTCVETAEEGGDTASDEELLKVPTSGVTAALESAEGGELAAICGKGCAVTVTGDLKEDAKLLARAAVKAMNAKREDF